VTRRTGLRVEAGAGGARVIVEGELDLDTRRALLAQAAQMDADRVAIDLRGLASIDSVGLTSLIEADRLIRERSGRPPRILVGESGPVRRMIELTLLHLTLDVRVA
jgi:anti-anti-sigma factor